MSPFPFSPGDGVVWASTEQPVSYRLQQCQTVIAQRMGVAWEENLPEPVVRNQLVVPPPLKRRGGERARLNFLIASDLC